jgi:hypothetical protein
MKQILSALVVAGSLALIPTQASAWYCKAVGIGATATGGAGFIERAKLRALRRCEHRAMGFCTILWCRP